MYYTLIVCQASISEHLCTQHEESTIQEIQLVENTTSEHSSALDLCLGVGGSSPFCYPANFCLQRTFGTQPENYVRYQVGIWDHLFLSTHFQSKRYSLACFLLLIFFFTPCFGGGSAWRCFFLHAACSLFLFSFAFLTGRMSRMHSSPCIVHLFLSHLIHRPNRLGVSILGVIIPQGPLSCLLRFCALLCYFFIRWAKTRFLVWRMVCWYLDEVSFRSFERAGTREWYGPEDKRRWYHGIWERQCLWIWTRGLTSRSRNIWWARTARRQDFIFCPHQIDSYDEQNEVDSAYNSEAEHTKPHRSFPLCCRGSMFKIPVTW